MHVEECCQEILFRTLPLLDRKRRGACIDIGVGTFAFYCELFACLGFSTIAVEPLPIEKLRQLCKHYKINLIESCISDHNGTCTLYVGTCQGVRDLNFSSTSPDWWGRSEESIQVRSLTLSSILMSPEIHNISCIKIDVEGSEQVVIEQFLQLSSHLLPTVVVFEYGGRDCMESGQGGWMAKYLDGTMNCLRYLKSLGYGLVVQIDGSPESMDEYFDLTQTDVTPEHIFKPHNIYGNFIVFRESPIDVNFLKMVCRGYRNNDIKPRALILKKKLWYQFLRLLRNPALILKKEPWYQFLHLFQGKLTQK